MEAPAALPRRPQFPRRAADRAAGPVLFVMAVVVAVAIVYRQAAFAYFIEDDFHWFAEARRFGWLNLLRVDRYDHFYRPGVEIYFFLGQRLFGCAAFPFHLASLSIHLLNTGVLFAFARRLTGSVRFAALAVILFVVQPAYVEAVAWVAAITDLLPALWYLLTLLLHLRFLQTGRWPDYGMAIGTFAACLLTHESAATLLPMMIAIEALLAVENRHPRGGFRAREWLTRYAPFALLLVAFLVIAYLVSSRSYLVREGYYAFGSHAFRNLFNYMVALYVGKRAFFDYVLIGAAVGAVLLRGTWRMRFLVVWILVTLLPVLFFTWEIASRYLYLPAAGFALLLTDLLMTAEICVARRIGPGVARAATITIAIALAVRFAAFAQEGSEDFRARTAPYERLVAAIVASNPSPPPDRTVYVEGRLVEVVPEIYRSPVAETALCAPDVRLMVR